VCPASRQGGSDCAPFFLSCTFSASHLREGNAGVDKDVRAGGLNPPWQCIGRCTYVSENLFFCSSRTPCAATAQTCREQRRRMDPMRRWSPGPTKAAQYAADTREHRAKTRSCRRPPSASTWCSNRARSTSKDGLGSSTPALGDDRGMGLESTLTSTLSAYTSRFCRWHVLPLLKTLLDLAPHALAPTFLPRPCSLALSLTTPRARVLGLPVCKCHVRPS
jgi:hypothetical protein